jgi:probable HAF family extracellular repeat protein
MKSFTVLRNLSSIALTACCVIGIANARAQTYVLTDLGIIPGQKTDTVVTPAAINDQGQVAGTSGASAFRYTRAKGEMEDAGGNPVGAISRGFGINSSGQVAGDSTFGKNEVSHAALFSNGVTTDLGHGGLFSRANGINALGHVVGFSSDRRDGTNSRAFFRKTANPSRMIDLGTLGGAYAQAFGINDSGSITGNAEIHIRSGAVTSHAFIWHVTTGMRDLNTLGGNSSYGTSINANNHVAGYSTINNIDERIHAFLYHDGKMLDLGSLSGASVDTDFSFALGVNADDVVVGYSYLPFDNGKSSINVPLGPWSVAFIYRNDLMVNLNDLIGAASTNYRLDSATAINDNGEIVAVAFDRKGDVFHAVLLTPNSDGSVKQ